MEIFIILCIVLLLCFVGFTAGVIGYSIAEENDWDLSELYKKVKFKLAKKSDLQKEILYRKETIKELKQQEQDWIELEKIRQEEEEMFEKIGSYEEKYRPLSDHEQIEKHYIEDDEEEIVGAIGGREKKVYFYRDVVDGNLVHKGVILEEPIETKNFWEKMKKEQQEREQNEIEQYKKKANNFWETVRKIENQEGKHIRDLEEYEKITD